ncbi:response regulator [Candidatus Falkowbacteria bacterium]|nr:response regulator [Candidatus Falkowbacteria bacterium]
MPKKILIAEDDKPMAKAMQLKLAKFGFEVEIAANGELALQALDKGTFDLILSDLVMPKMDGFELLAEIKKRNIKTPVIVTTNLGQPGDEKKAKELGAKDYFIKSNTTILALVDHVKNF